MAKFFSPEAKRIVVLLIGLGLFVYIYVLNERITSLRYQNDVYSHQIKSLRQEQAELKDELAAKTKEYSAQLELISKTYQELSNLPTDESIIQKMPVSLNSDNNWDEILRPIKLTLYGDSLLY